MIWWFDCLLLLKSKVWFRTVYSFQFDDWQLIKWQWDLNSNQSISFISSILFAFYTYWNRWVAWREMIKRAKRRMICYWWNTRDRNWYIKLRKSFRFSTFHFHIHNTQRSVRSNSNLWRCFWHDSALHVS